MVLSHKYKFIFIKNAKSAGTSIEVYLSDHCGEEDVLTPIFPEVAAHRPRNYESCGFKNHMSAEQIRQRVSDDVWNNYFKFCVERNPWDKTLSHYHMLNYRAGGTLTLDEYFLRGSFCLNYPRYTDHDGRIIVDKIVRYEELSEGLSEVFGRLGVPFDGDLRVNAKGEYRSDRRHYRDVFSTQQARRVAELFEVEINLHGYQY